MTEKLAKIRSKCINCGELRSCLKIEARAPLAHAVLVYNEKFNTHERVDYETHGAMVEVCRGCLRDPLCPLARHLSEQL